MNKDEYERMYQLEDRLWWYAGMRLICCALLDGVLADRPRGRGATADGGRRTADGSQPQRLPVHPPSAVRRPPSPSGRPLRILDAGCGTGGAAVWLSGYGAVTALDWSGDALGFCRRRRLTRLCRGSITALPFAGDSFDLVTVFDVIYHLAVDDDRAALRETHRVLAPGGVALIRVPAFEFLRSRHDEAVHTRQRYRRPELVDKLRTAGFEVRRATYANTLLFPLAAARRLFSRHGRGSHGESDVQPVHPGLNRVLTAALALEAGWLQRTDLPFGLSVVAVAVKPAAAGGQGSGVGVKGGRRGHSRSN